MKRKSNKNVGIRIIAIVLSVEKLRLFVIVVNIVKKANKKKNIPTKIYVFSLSLVFSLIYLIRNYPQWLFNPGDYDPGVQDELFDHDYSRSTAKGDYNG